METLKKICSLNVIAFIFLCVGASLALSQTVTQVPFVVYNSEKVFRNSELGQELIRSYNKTVQIQVDEADLLTKGFESEEKELIKKRKKLTSEKFKVLADDFDKRVRDARNVHKEADNQLRKMYRSWKENFFNETLPRAFEPISKEYGVYAAVDLSTSDNLVYRDDIEVTELFIIEINKLYRTDKRIFEKIIEFNAER